MKLRFMCFLLVFAFTVSLFSACVNEPEDTLSVVSSDDISDESLEFNPSVLAGSIGKELFRYTCFEDAMSWTNYNKIFDIECAKKTENGETLFIFNSKDDVESFVSQVPYDETEYSKEALGFLRNIKNHDEEFFKEKILIMSVFGHSTNGFEYELDSLTIKDGTLKLKYLYSSASVAADCVSTKYYVITEIKREYVSSCEKFFVDVIQDPFVSLEYNAQMLDGKFDDSKMASQYVMGIHFDEVEPYVISTKDEAEHFLTLLDASSTEAINFLKALPEGYFDDKTLIVNAFVLPNAGYKYGVSDVRKTSNNIAVFYKCSYRDGDDVEILKISFIELEKEDIGNRGIYAKINVPL